MAKRIAEDMCSDPPEDWDTEWTDQDIDRGVE